jgi:hypothetical protein
MLHTRQELHASYLTNAGPAKHNRPVLYSQHRDHASARPKPERHGPKRTTVRKMGRAQDMDDLPTLNNNNNS